MTRSGYTQGERGAVQPADPLRMAFDAAPTGQLLVDAQGRIVLANRAAEALLGYERDELLGQPVETLVPSAASSVRAVGEAGAPWAVRKDGSRVPVEVQLGACRASRGSFALCSVAEPTERRQIERERDRMFELSRELLFVNGTKGVLKRVNPAVTEALGYSAAELTSRPFVEFIHPDDRELAMAVYQRHLAGETFDSELRALCKDGSQRVLLCTATFDAECDVIYAVGHDITERKRQEEALRQAKLAAEAANHELETFSYSVSHDLRAPLRAIDGFSQALLEEYGDRLDAAGAGYLRRVLAATLRMSELIEALLSLSRISRTALRIQEVDLSAVARSVIEELRAAEPERRVEFEVAEGVVVRGDPRLLRLVLQNLLANAWKYSRKRDCAHVEFGRAFVDGEQAWFVRDDGVGFDMTYAERLFTAFQRLHREEDFEGTGVGLAIVQRIVHMHGGRVWGEGVVDDSAVFFFTLGAEARG